MISVQKVAPTSTIVVNGVEGIPDDAIVLHFESPKHGGGGECITKNRESGSALVEFKDRSGNITHVKHGFACNGFSSPLMKVASLDNQT